MIKTYRNGSWYELEGNKMYLNGSWQTLSGNDRVRCNGTWEPMGEPFTLTAQQANSTVSLKMRNPDTVIWCRTNTSPQWRVCDTGKFSSSNAAPPVLPTPETVTLANVGDYVQFWNVNWGLLYLDTGGTIYIPNFVMTGALAGSGNLQALSSFTGGVNDLSAYHSGSAWHPASWHYSGLFRDCSALTSLPELTSSDLPYEYLCFNCTSLTSAVINANLRQTPRASGQGVNFMFYGCTNLNRVEVSWTQWPTDRSQDWLYNVSSTGTFVCPYGLTIPSEDASGVPYGWTIQRK